LWQGIGRGLHRLSVTGERRPYGPPGELLIAPTPR
jgi:hypothetical protein